MIFHAPNTFKPVSQIGAINNMSSTVLYFNTVVYSMRSCPKTRVLSLKKCPQYISGHCPKTQAISISFLTLYFRALCQNPSFIF